MRSRIHTAWRALLGRGSGRGFQPRDGGQSTPPSQARDTGAENTYGVGGQSPLRGRILLWEGL